MAPAGRGNSRIKRDLPAEDARKAGVLALFYPGAGNETHLLFILRNTYEGIHSNQVGFPGGQQESGDKSLEETALRETEEEVGVERSRVSVIRPMSDLYIPPSNFDVRPFIALYDKRKPFIPDPIEVASLIEVPLQDVMNDRHISVRTMRTALEGEIEVPVFELAGYVVWGATAMMVSEIKAFLKQMI